MKNRKVKGFTLVECLVALAILGIASLTMAQIYAQISKINKFNNENNTSLAYQMKYVEKYINADTTMFPCNPSDPEKGPPINTKKNR